MEKKGIGGGERKRHREQEEEKSHRMSVISRLRKQII